MDLVIDFAIEESKRNLYFILKNLHEVKYNIRIEKQRKKRSVDQNEYYHACIVKALSDYLGYTIEEMHDVLKLKFNPKQKVNRITGECYTVGGSTTKMNTAEFEDYLQSIRIWALQELEFLIMLPNEYIRRD